MKSMNDMTMEELLAADAAINRHFFEEARFLSKLRQEKGDDPPEWAVEIDADIQFQERMGAFRCDDCGAIIKHNEFYCKNCTALRQAKEQMNKANETRRLLNE